jgi:AmmeMemoRadiSam system protein B
MDAIETGKHDAFIQELQSTGSTVCGRHPIGVVMAGLESLEGEGKGKFKFVRYERSSDAMSYTDSSVSYASAYAVL